ncbi:MAG: dihydrodipicolinate synthase family protein [Gemmatimonadota bacterium]
MAEFTGVFAPVTTPFDEVTGDLDLVGFRSNARQLLATELAGIVLFGSTGEGLLVEDAERVAALESVQELAWGKLVLAGAGAESTREAIRIVRLSADAGADAVLVSPPAYYRPQMTPEALLEHYVAVADSSPVPILLYQVPPVYSGIDLQAGLVGELSKHWNIRGIKDSTGDLQAMGEIVESCSAGFEVIVGNGAVLYGAMEVGATGGILGVATIAPRECAEIFSLKESGRDAEAGALQERIAPLHRAVVGKYGVPGVKAALDLLGLVGGRPRPPLLPLREKDRQKVRAALAAADLLATDPPS